MCWRIAVQLYLLLDMRKPLYERLKRFKQSRILFQLFYLMKMVIYFLNIILLIRNERFIMRRFLNKNNRIFHQVGDKF